MSRSYRKNIVITDGQDTSKFRKKRKNRANRRVRQSEELSNGASFKRVYDSWNICDWKFRYFKDLGKKNWKWRTK